MSNDNYVDPFTAMDADMQPSGDGNPFFNQMPVTPGVNDLNVKSTAKLLVVIFVIDNSRTMNNGRIEAVNAALKELKYKLVEIKEDNNLELKVALMSFTSSARWEVELTPIEEVDFPKMETRAGLTIYGAAFHELNKVLRKEAYMKYTGKKAAPAIIFLTDGEPSDNYQHDLDELLKNGWFANATRSAVLLGDAIHNPAAREAVRQFVNDESGDIVAADDSTMLIEKIKLATMHTLSGEPMGDDQNNGGRTDQNPPTSNPDPGPFPPFPGSDPFPNTGNDPFPDTATDADPFPDLGPTICFPTQDDLDDADSTDDDPFGKDGDPFGAGGDPFGNSF